MNAPKAKRRTYWLADTVTPLMRDRALQLAHKGYVVQFYTSLDAMLVELQARRAAIVVVSDDGADSFVTRALTALSATPEVQGAKLILVTGRAADAVKRLAAAGNFRDFLPVSLDERQWLARFAYASAARPMVYTQPAGQITMNNISSLAVPARITWISAERLRLEARIKPPVGANLGLAGAFADAAGVSNVSLKVVSTHRSHLQYRFSDAIIAEWSVPAAARDQALRALSIQGAQPQGQGPRCRVFVAAQTPSLRQEILSRFDDARFEVNTALQKQSLVDEPRFFTPDVVLIEAALALDEGAERFHKMMEQLAPEASVIVVGIVPQLADWHHRYPGRKILALPSLPANLTQTILTKYTGAKRAAPTPDWEPGAVNILHDNTWSFAELSVPARLHRIHPLAAQVALPVQIGNFAICRLESPLVRKILGRNPWLKITGSYPDAHPMAGSFGHLAEGYLADVDLAERRELAQHLARIVGDSLLRLDAGAAIPDPQERAGDSRTPELGIVQPAERPAPRPLHAPPPPPAAETAETAAPRVSLPPAAVAAQGGGAAARRLEPEFVSEPGEKLIPTDEIASLIRPAIAPIERIAHGIRDDVQRKVHDSKLRGNLKMMLAWLAIMAGTALVIWFIAAVVAPNWERSGGQYSDQLKKFAPHLDQSGGR